MVPRVTRGIVRNFDSDFLIDFNHITNSAGHTVYTFDSEMVYNYTGEPIWRITKDAIVDLVCGAKVYTFRDDLILDAEGVIRYKIIPSDFPNLCTTLGTEFLCDVFGRIAYVMREGYITDDKGIRHYSIDGNRFESIDRPGCYYEIDGDKVRDENWEIRYTICRNRILDKDGHVVFLIMD